MPIIRSARNTAIRRGKNLSVIVRHARVFGATQLVRLTSPSPYTLRVDYPNGDYCETTFADASVLQDWIANRVRYGRGRFCIACNHE